MKNQEGVGVKGGSWFEASLTRRLGNGFNTYFWSDCLVGAATLKERFHRLYDLSNHKDMTVGEMHALGWGEEGEAWGWRCRLLAWEEELVEEVKLLLSNISLQETSSDVWL